MKKSAEAIFSSAIIQCQKNDSGEYRDIYIRPDLLPPAETLTLKEVRILAKRIANQFANAPVTPIRRKRKYVIDTGIYNLVIACKTPKGAAARAKCHLFWRESLENMCNIARLNYEAANRLVGGPDEANTEVYSSSNTVERMRQKNAAKLLALERMTLINTTTGKETSMKDIAAANETNRFNELYSFTKNFEEIARENIMKWLFVTFTAPPEYHPNPANPDSKCTYNPKLGLKASHEHISLAWKRIRAILHKEGIPAGPTTYFGARTVEVHKDGCIHWHLLVFIKERFICSFTKYCKDKFPLYAQLKIVLGDDDRGKASSYIFKYIFKEFNVDNLNEEIRSKLDLQSTEIDIERERLDLSSIRNSERIQAALKAMSIKQYQTIGLLSVTTILRRLNKLDLSDILTEKNSITDYIKTEVWRNPMGLKNILKRPELFSHSVSDNPPVKVLKSTAINRYGENTFKTIGIEIDGRIFSSEGQYKIVVKAGKSA